MVDMLMTTHGKVCEGGGLSNSPNIHTALCAVLNLNTGIRMRLAILHEYIIQCLTSQHLYTVMYLILTV